MGRLNVAPAEARAGDDEILRRTHRGGTDGDRYQAVSRGSGNSDDEFVGAFFNNLGGFAEKIICCMKLFIALARDASCAARSRSRSAHTNPYDVPTIPSINAATISEAAVTAPRLRRMNLRSR